MKNENLIRERIKQGLCPVCANPIKKPVALIEDPIYGLVEVCSIHTVELTEKIQE